jgi:hypothetical protein
VPGTFSARAARASAPLDELGDIAGRRRGWRGRLGLALKVASTVGVVGWVVHGLEVQAIAAAVSRADVALVALALTCTVALNALKPVRWFWLLRGLVPEASYAVAVRSHLFAVGARMVLPGKLGELARVVDIDALPLLGGIGLAVIELLMETSAACLFGVAGAALVVGAVPAGALAGFGLALLVGVVRPHWLFAAASGLPFARGLRARVGGVRAVMSHVGTNALLGGLALSVACHVLRFAQLYLLLVALGAIPGAGALICLPLVQLADAVAFTIGGIGVREMLGVHVLPPFGVSAEHAVAAIALQFVLTNVVPGAVGGWVARTRCAQAATRLRAALPRRARTPD